MPAISTEVYYSSCEVLVETQKHGILDVSDDVKSVSVSRRMDGISTASVSLLDYSTYSSGKYNGIIHVGDRVHIAYFKDTRRVDQFTGRVSKTPALMFQADDFAFSCEDCIADLNYIWWDPFSAKAYEKFNLQPMQAYAEGKYNDGAGGERLKSFLKDVCGFPEKAIRIAKFPELDSILKAIIDIAKGSNDESPDALAAKLYDTLFGAATDYGDVGEDNTKTHPTDNATALHISDQAKDAADIVRAMFGKDQRKSCDAKWWDGKVMFGYNKCTKWSKYSGEAHTGLYGLTKSQMSKYTKKNQDANKYDEYTQYSCLLQVLESLSKAKDGGYGSPMNLALAYFTGTTPKVSKGKLSWPGLHDADGVYFGLVFPYTRADLQKVMHCNASGKLLAGSHVSQPGKPRSDSKDSKPTNALAAKFGDWVKANTGKYVDVDGAYGAQCWDLWHWYYKDFLKLDDGQWQLQPAGGNQAFWQQFPQSSYYASNFEKLDTSKKWQAGDVFFGKNGGMFDPSAGHVGIVTKDDGTNVQVFDQNSPVGSAPRANTYPKSAFAGVLRPKALGGQPGEYDGSSSSASSSSDVTTSSAQQIAQQAARNESLKLFKYLNMGDTSQLLQANMYQGKIRMKNDRPCIEFVKSLCSATMRSFMSLPDGSFAAFVPDWWGIYKLPGTNNVVEVPAIDVISFKSDIDKSSYVSHLFLTTAEYAADPTGIMGNSSVFGTGATADIIGSMYSSGTITIEDMAEQLSHFMDLSATGLATNGRTTKQTLLDLMQKWGVNVRCEQDNYITDKTLTTISALTRFLKYWANCFHTSMSLAFRPEIMPGHRLHFPDAHCTLFVQTVTHSWTATSGGSTSVSVVAPVTDAGKVGIAIK